MTKTNTILAHLCLTGLSAYPYYIPGSSPLSTASLLFVVGSLWSANFAFVIVLLGNRKDS